MKLWKSLSATFVCALHHPHLWLLQFFGNVVIAVTFMLWLQIPDAYWWELFFQAVMILIVAAATLLLHCGTLNYYSDISEGKNAELKPAFKNALKHLPAFAISVALLCVLFYFADDLRDYQFQFPGYLRSEFPAWLRRHISEASMDNLYDGFAFIIRWIVVPALVLPICLLCARVGFRAFIGFRPWWKIIRSLAFWIVLVLAVLIGVYCTGKILDWRLNPNTATLREEKVWLAFRLPIVYLLGLFSWLWLCCVVVRASTQPDPPAASQKVAA